MIHKSQFLILTKSWLLPILIAAGLFFITKPFVMRLAEAQNADLSDYLNINNIDIGEETVDGNRQVYYLYQGEKHFITNGGQNSHSPVTNGEYVVYLKDINGAPQVYLFDVLTNNEIKLSSSESNNSPYVSKEGNVVWEGWVNENNKWQVFLFDGKSVKEITNGDLSINPYIEGDMITYARRDITGEWKSSIYSMKTQKEKDIAVGNKTQYTKLKDGKIIFALPGVSEEEFNLTAEDLFTLDLAPLTSTESGNLQKDLPLTVSVDEIFQELQIPQASESASSD